MLTYPTPAREWGVNTSDKPSCRCQDSNKRILSIHKNVKFYLDSLLSVKWLFPYPNYKIISSLLALPKRILRQITHFSCLVPSLFPFHYISPKLTRILKSCLNSPTRVNGLLFFPPKEQYNKKRYFLLSWKQRLVLCRIYWKSRRRHKWHNEWKLRIWFVVHQLRSLFVTKNAGKGILFSASRKYWIWYKLRWSFVCDCEWLFFSLQITIAKSWPN